MLPSIASPYSLDAARVVAEIYLRRRRWRAAADVLEQMIERDPASDVRVKFCRNLSAIETFRPNLYAILVASAPEDRYVSLPAPSGKPTIFFIDPAGQRVCLSPGGDPVSTLAQLAEMEKNLAAQGQAGSPLGIVGLGDGYLLAAMAARPPELFLDRQQCVFIFEPDPRLLLLALTIHDYSGPAGPIEQARFQWLVGADFDAQFARLMHEDSYLPFPTMNLRQSVCGAEIEAKALAVVRGAVAEDARSAEEIEKYYAALSTDELRAVYSDQPPRRPRVLLITSRFTTVLQYSTKDAAEAFGQMGWDALVLIEPEPYHVMRKQVIRRALRDFKPDLVFQIDHLRHEAEGMYPPNLPFACWIQDHLPNLTNRAAGAKVKDRDFVLTSVGSHYCRMHDYPASQIVPLPNLARVPALPDRWDVDGVSDGADLVYVSHWSQRAADVARETVAQAGTIPELKRPMETVCEEMARLYARGEQITCAYDARQLLDRVFNQLGVAVNNADFYNQLVNLLFDRLNNVLYRQQAIRWAAEACRRRGWTLELYGRGWDKNPEFAEFAKGPITPGEPFNAMTRRTKINLQLEPYASFTHPRLLSGLFAGGFFLIRQHPFNSLPQELLNFVVKDFDDSVQTVADARRQVSPDRRGALDAMLKKCARLTEQLDPIETVRNWQQSQVLLARESSLPHLEEVSFWDADSLEKRAASFLADPPRRRKIAAAQRQDLAGRLSYVSGLTRTVKWIGNRIGG